MTIRPARLTDDAELVRLDHDTWSWDVAPVPRSPLDRNFFGDRAAPADVLVATWPDEPDRPVGSAERLAGYVRLGPNIPIESNAHVLQIQGLAVAPDAQRRGIARQLLVAAEAEARARGARKLALRVLGTNAVAQALYASEGFVVEGVLSDEFLLDGQYVDDVLMAKELR